MVALPELAQNERFRRHIQEDVGPDLSSAKGTSDQMPNAAVTSRVRIVSFDLERLQMLDTSAAISESCS